MRGHFAEIIRLLIHFSDTVGKEGKSLSVSVVNVWISILSSTRYESASGPGNTFRIPSAPRDSWLAFEAVSQGDADYS